eukprot:ctg_534.g302
MSASSGNRGHGMVLGACLRRPGGQTSCSSSRSPFGRGLTCADRLRSTLAGERTRSPPPSSKHVPPSLPHTSSNTPPSSPTSHEFHLLASTSHLHAQSPHGGTVRPGPTRVRCGDRRLGHRRPDHRHPTGLQRRSRAGAGAICDTRWVGRPFPARRLRVRRGRVDDIWTGQRARLHQFAHPRLGGGRRAGGERARPGANSLPPARSATGSLAGASRLCAVAGRAHAALSARVPRHSRLLRRVLGGVPGPQRPGVALAGRAALSAAGVSAEPAGVLHPAAVSGRERGRCGSAVDSRRGAAALYRHRLLRLVGGGGRPHAHDQRRDGVQRPALRRNQLPGGRRGDAGGAAGECAAGSGALSRLLGGVRCACRAGECGRATTGHGCDAGRRAADPGARGDQQRHPLGHVRAGGRGRVGAAGIGGCRRGAAHGAPLASVVHRIALVSLAAPGRTRRCSRRRPRTPARLPPHRVGGVGAHGERHRCRRHHLRVHPHGAGCVGGAARSPHLPRIHTVVDERVARSRPLRVPRPQAAAGGSAHRTAGAAGVSRPAPRHRGVRGGHAAHPSTFSGAQRWHLRADRRAAPARPAHHAVQPHRPAGAVLRRRQHLSGPRPERGGL